ncbi:MAG: cation diffusion facilitator family transporter [Candidatus Saccharibacteria bacterium]|nr:cation diffusion facilitator family transporter [Candidatus Saccharibacteria bacterium]
MADKLKKTKASSRDQIIIKSGFIFIAVNFFLGVFNIIIGLLAGSIAITSDAVHSFIDSISGFLIVISEKLSSHHKLSQHRTKIERVTTIIIALIIVIAGVHIIVESIEKILVPESPEYSTPTFIVLVASIALKYLLASYLKRTGKAQKSTVLIASGAETMNDTWISVAVLFSAIFYLIFHLDIEAYISILIALLIIKVGLEFIFPHLSHHHHHPLESDPSHGTNVKA